MSEFILSTDSCCDELKDNLKKMDIEYIPLVYIDGDIEHKDNFTTNEEYKFFYDEQKQGKYFKTAGLNNYDVEEYFKDLLKKYKKDVIHLTLSSGLSLTHSVCESVANELNEKSDGPKIHVIDSKSATQGQKLVLYFLRKCRDANMNVADTLSALEEKMTKKSVEFFVTDLDHLKNGGRISMLQAAIGKLLQLRPMIEFNSEGKLNVFDKVIGTKRAIRQLAEKAYKLYDKNSGDPLYIAHTGNMDMVYELVALLEKEFINPLIIIGYIGPVVGSHTGPDALGLVFFKKN